MNPQAMMKGMQIAQAHLGESEIPSADQLCKVNVFLTAAIDQNRGQHDIADFVVVNDFLGSLEKMLRALEAEAPELVASLQASGEAPTESTNTEG